MSVRRRRWACTSARPAAADMLLVVTFPPASTHGRARVRGSSHSGWMRLSRAFFGRPVDVVAHDLVGCIIERGGVRLRIVEVEAYAGDDSACHAFKGPTPRTAPLFGPPGHAYIYLCYGIHTMLNLVAGEDGVAAGVLIRAAEVVGGSDIVTARRGRDVDAAICSGPGKVGAALALETRHSGTDICTGDYLSLHEGPPPRLVLSGPRVGIDYADPADIARAWRFADADSIAVSHRRLLLNAAAPEPPMPKPKKPGVRSSAAR